MDVPHRIPTAEYRALLDLYMAADPSPVDDETDETVQKFLANEAARYGYDGWIEAYHEVEA